MAMSIEIVRKTRNLEKLIDRIQKTRGKTVETGYFQEQGVHSEYGIPYGRLMQIHEFGMFGLPERPVQLPTQRYMKNTYSGWAINIKRYLQGTVKLENALFDIGDRASSYAKGVFGDPFKLEPNAQSTVEEKGSNTPLVDTGELRDKWAFRTSYSGIITNSSYGG
ncbi:MAG: hypothetical protein GOVbin4162_23 [Prokaryotic dsDNA virus sp.]|nr:MAG: hypothetical protein GOVbin4162_23 [Prokaryotic dsDNA virus sp.]